MKLRNRLLTLHGFVGILGGLLLVVMGLTGSAIVFHQEIDRTLNPHLMQVVPQGERVAIATFFSSAQAAIPNARLESIQFPQTPDATYHLGFKSGKQTWQEMFIHPYTGKILGIRQSGRTLISILYAIHHDFSAGTVGLYLVGISGLILILQAITGLILWTGWRKLATGFRIRWGAPTQLLNFDLHNVGGAIANLFLLMIGLTGVVIVIAHIVLDPHHEAQIFPPFQPAIAINELLQTADNSIPDGTTTSVSFPDAQKMVVMKKLPQDHPRLYFSSVTVDGATGNVLQVNKVVEKPLMWKFLTPIVDLHFGSFGGLPTRILYVFIGFMPLMLLITGVIMWKRRRLKSKREEMIVVHR
ncbi:PepSY domain-containing protein [Calothrix sp. PCC 7507]|uniref:PepSY-associated TM helix domain-containing protein n=1 Tax=Calothrix sp. PCC 7507 TaxID=99598 RepID=UPI00029F31AD|nr:PepSY-associated TM helix domain-containing protein [Calothrix sp. PCC 7507]AFY33149.1 PepSY-associated TM helix domain protein [Calothrix sp. PCC 7507]